MTRISINLLPPEVTARELQNAKFLKIQFAGIMVILFMIFITALTLALQLLQELNIAAYQTRLTRAEEKTISLKNTQASLFVLKNRISMIDKYLGASSPQTSMYKLVDKLIPSSVAISSIAVEKNGDVIFLAIVPDSVSLDNLIENLTKRDKNEGKIKEVSVDSFARGRDGIYRVSFKIKPT